MAQMHREFDAAAVEPGSEMTADTAFTGWHPMQFVESEWKSAKSGNGDYLELVAQVIEGQFKGRKLWKRLNLCNASEKAVEIAEHELSAICHAVGVMRPKDTVELHGRPFLGNVVYKPATDRGGAVNEIAQNAFKPMGTGVSAPTTYRAPQSAPAPAAQSSTPVWARK